MLTTKEEKRSVTCCFSKRLERSSPRDIDISSNAFIITGCGSFFSLILFISSFNSVWIKNKWLGSYCKSYRRFIKDCIYIIECARTILLKFSWSIINLKPLILENLRDCDSLKITMWKLKRSKKCEGSQFKKLRLKSQKNSQMWKAEDQKNVKTHDSKSWSKDRNW